MGLWWFDDFSLFARLYQEIEYEVQGNLLALNRFNLNQYSIRLIP